MTAFSPLLIGDCVQVVHGKAAGRTGRVTLIEEDRTTVHVYFGEHREELPNGALSSWTETDKFLAEHLLFRGRPAAAAIVPPTRLAAPPPVEPGLEASALATIWDDDVRLVYADWLEEQMDDPHAEYLRVQVALGRAIRAGHPFESLVDRERRLRAILNPHWVSRFRRLTTQPPPFDVASLDPAYAAHARTAIRLHPRSGDVPDPAASKIGGLFLWPEKKPWPTAAGLTVAPEYAEMFGPFPKDWATVHLVPLIQLNRRDVPQLPFPPGTDLMQVFWCPYLTGEHAPESFVIWRNSTSVRNPRREPNPLPKCHLGAIPTPSRLYPEAIVEYPVADQVPENRELQCAVSDWAETWPEPASCYSYWWNRCHGWKVGGYPWVNQSDCVRVERTSRAGTPMEYLLQVSDEELDHCGWRWCPVEDRNLCFAGAAWGLIHEGGGLSVLTRGNYHLLLDRSRQPWVVESFYDSAG